jgi:hypothetical protein
LSHLLFKIFNVLLIGISSKFRRARRGVSVWIDVHLNRKFYLPERTSSATGKFDIAPTVRVAHHPV